MAEGTEGFDSAAEVLCDELRMLVSAVPDNKKTGVQEIRLRTGRPLALTDGSSALFIDGSGRVLYSMSEKAFIVTRRHVYDTFRRLCGYSVYSYQEEIRNGFITVKGGHRVGLCGTASVKDGRITAVSDISSLNIRISRQITGCADELIKRLCPLSSGVLIAGAPSSGKTTLLRDLARSLSVGRGCRIMRTVVIDERGELSGTYQGTPYNDLGLCDILNGYPKGEGIMHAVRALSPQVIVCDELGGRDDCRAAAQGFNAGAVIAATIHAGSLDELYRRPQARELLGTGAFGTAVMLSTPDRPCRIAEAAAIDAGAFV